MPTPALRPPVSPRVRSARRGFTLVELIVAMAAGLTVSLAAFILAKNATQVFQHEARISAAHMSVMLGMNRLVGDLQRAAFLSSPNVTLDPFRCSDQANWPTGLKQLAGVYIEKAGSEALYGAELDQSTKNENDFHPDRLIIGGSFSTTEQFSVRTIVAGAGGGQLVYLQTDSLAYVRTVGAQASSGTALGDIFKAGRFFRIVDTMGRHEYGVINGFAVAGNNVTIQLEPTPWLQEKREGNTCGYSGLAVGMLANPIHRVAYEIRSMAKVAGYEGVVAPVSDGVTGDAGRTELVRVELDPEGAVIEGTEELVAEYAVDLKFGVTTATAAPNPVVTRWPISVPESQEVYDFAGDVTAGGHPEMIRAVQVRLATRARAGDRTADLDTHPGDGRKLRFLIDDGIPSPRYARIRTLYADVSLPNQMSLQW